jgi:myo-inositol-1-phosphate synthase
MKGNMNKINVAIVGVGNCAGSLIEGINYYSKSKTQEGLLFPSLGGYCISDINIVCAFDISNSKVGKSIDKAIYAKPNNFVRLGNIKVKPSAMVYRGHTLDGNPEHLAKFVTESSEEPVNVIKTLLKHKVDIVVNLLPTGSVAATMFYGDAALKAGSAFINCIPTVYAQRREIESLFKSKKLPLLGDDIKSQVGSTIIHRALLNMLVDRGAKLTKSSQVNIGGNTDFANFVYRAETKLVSKYKSLQAFIPKETPSHIGHHYDQTKGPYKKTLFDIEASVFAGSPVKISVQLQSDDKPNSSGSIVDLIRIAMSEKVKRRGGIVKAACGYYMKSAPVPMLDKQAYALVIKNWVK